ncbi:MAG: UDP-N-acetylmuramoyl-tripeptide--D-alanyl-D-alanine ligase [Bacteroidia bacterium]|nr:UDP-N-acetylmuramoyl-tripeptide--D-alanyl-D-alanine ligase [Bacteroidia bacterium]
MQETSVRDLYEAFLKCNQKVCTDTRKLDEGSIFFCLKGANFNANELALKALEGGCAYVVVDEEKFAINKNALFVKDVLKALQQLANHHRNQLKLKVLAITGSNGKTTNKELINAVLSKSFKTLATVGNLNNHIGVPLTLLSLTKEHEIAIVEMGANHQGEIKELCEIAEPDYGLITNIGKAHLEGFGGEEGVKKGKGEMYKYISKKGGRVFINADDAVLHEMAGAMDKITYGTTKLYDVIGKQINGDEFVSFKWTTRYNEKDWNKLPLVKTHIIGHYNFINLLCAACVGNYFKVDIEKINEALSEYVPDMNRSQLEKTANNTLILDAYNANPSSMKVAIDNFAKMEGENKLLIIGDMFELGEYAAEEHKKIVDLINEKKLSNVILIGSEFSKTNSGFKTFLNTQDCLENLKSEPQKNKLILIKGSRGMKLEILKEAL